MSNMCRSHNWGRIWPIYTQVHCLNLPHFITILYKKIICTCRSTSLRDGVEFSWKQTNHSRDPTACHSSNSERHTIKANSYWAYYIFVTSISLSTKLPATPTQSVSTSYTQTTKLPTTLTGSDTSTSYTTSSFTRSDTSTSYTKLPAISLTRSDTSISYTKLPATSLTGTSTCNSQNI